VTAREEPDGTAERPYPIGAPCMDCGARVIGLPTRLAILPHEPTCPRVRHIPPSSRLPHSPHIEIALSSQAREPLSQVEDASRSQDVESDVAQPPERRRTSRWRAPASESEVSQPLEQLVDRSDPRRRPRLERRAPTSGTEIPRAIDQLFDRFNPPPRRDRGPAENGSST
jgi:hypothetical protein